MQNIPLPQEDEPQLSKSQRRKRRKLKPQNMKCRNFVVIIGVVVFVAILLAFVMLSNKQKGFVKECEVFDCTKSFKAVGKIVKLQDDSSINSQNSQKWEIQKNMWIYRSQNLPKQNKQKQLFNKLNEQNTKHFASKSNYTIKQFTLQGSNQILSAQSATKVSQIQQILQNRFEGFQSNKTSKQSRLQIFQNKQHILRRLIVYFLMLEHGGVFIDHSVTIVEPLDEWLEKIIDVPYINVGDKLESLPKPQCFGFFDSDYSSLRLKANVKRQYEFERKVVAFPGLKDEFLACQKGSQFLMKWTQTYVGLLKQGRNSTKLAQLNSNENLIGKTDLKMIYRDGHLIASHIVLQQRQAQLNAQSLNHSDQNSIQYTKLAIDSFGLITINKNLAPQKLQSIFLHQDKCYSFLTKLPRDQMQLSTGKLRFVVFLTPLIKWKIGRHIIHGSSKEQYFVDGSFVYQHFLRYLSNNKVELMEDFKLKTVPQLVPIHGDPEQNIGNSQWKTLPNNFWIIWDKGLKRHSKPIIQLCYENLKKSTQASNFSLEVIQKENIEKFISLQLRHRMKQSINNASQFISSQTISDFWRLALLYENGGVYVDASTFTTGQNYDWIRNITRVPSKMLWNRYGAEPEVFIFWNSLLGCPTDWYFDQKHKTKSQWHLSYESNFIAAVKESSFIKQWLQVFMQWITLPYDQIYKQMESVGMQNYKWIKRDYRYLIVMDAVKYVVGRRQKMLRESQSKEYSTAADYYKIWSMPGQMIGQQKFRGDYNFESQDYRLDYMDQEILNLYKYESSWEFAEGLLGSLEYQTKFFGLDLRETEFLLDNFYRENQSQNFTLAQFQRVIHPDSVFGKLLLFRNETLTLKLMKFYNELSMERLRLKGVKLMGI